MSYHGAPTRARRAVVAGLLANIALAGVKLVAGLLGHSYALVADAVESLTDIVGSVVVWSGLRIAARPADENHPYGHGKAEPLAALLVAAIIFVAGAGILFEAIAEIITPHHAPAPFTLAVLVGVVVIKEGLFRFMSRTAREHDSSVLHADAWHHRADAITSIAAFVGISVALIGGKGWEMADDIAAILASLVIMYNAYRLVRDPIHELMDAEPSDVVERAREIAAGIDGVRMVEKSWARKAGAGHWLDLHVQVDPAMPVLEAHDIAHRVKDAIREAIPSVRDVLVHIEPYRPRGEASAGVEL